MVSGAAGNIPSNIVGVIGSPSPATQQVQALRVQTPISGRLTVPLPQTSGVQLLAPQQQIPASVGLSQSAVASRIVQPACITSVAAPAVVSAPNGQTPISSLLVQHLRFDERNLFCDEEENCNRYTCKWKA
jgi:hypothetical protein